MAFHFVTGAISVVWIVVIFFDVFEVMLLPRRMRRRLRLVRVFFRSTWSVWSAIALRLSPGDARETMLSFYGPFSMLLLIVFWISNLICGFGCLQWAIEQSMPVVRELYMSGATFFTLGYGDVTPLTRASRIVAICEAGTGFGFIAVVIGYLPVLYQLFSSRETHVIQLDARAGSPPSAITLLTRHADGGGIDNLYRLLESWEAWASEMVESHLSYPMLSFYRSQHDNQSWLAAMCAILDASALMLVGLRGVETFPAKMAFATSRLALTELSRVFDIKTSGQRNRSGDYNFELISTELAKAGLFFSSDDAERTLLAFRGTYEPFIVGLSEYLLLPLPGWLPSESLDNWQNSPRGRQAKQLVNDAPARPR